MRANAQNASAHSIEHVQVDYIAMTQKRNVDYNSKHLGGIE